MINLSKHFLKIHKFPFYLFRIFRDVIYTYYHLGSWNYTWRFHDLPIIKKHLKSKIEIGNHFIACSNASYNSIGVFQKVMLFTISESACIKIGNNVGISGSVISCQTSIIIGDNVLIGSGVLITDNDAHSVNPLFRRIQGKNRSAPILIENDVFVGARSIILKGVTLGEGCVVGAGSVVASNVEHYSIVIGNPARKIGDVRDLKYS